MNYDSSMRILNEIESLVSRGNVNESKNGKQEPNVTDLTASMLNKSYHPQKLSMSKYSFGQNFTTQSFPKQSQDLRQSLKQTKTQFLNSTAFPDSELPNNRYHFQSNIKQSITAKSYAYPSIKIYRKPLSMAEQESRLLGFLNRYSQNQQVPIEELLDSLNYIFDGLLTNYISLVDLNENLKYTSVVIRENYRQNLTNLYHQLQIMDNSLIKIVINCNSLLILAKLLYPDELQQITNCAEIALPKDTLQLILLRSILSAVFVRENVEAEGHIHFKDSISVDSIKIVSEFIKRTNDLSFPVFYSGVGDGAQSSPFFVFSNSRELDVIQTFGIIAFILKLNQINPLFIQERGRYVDLIQYEYFICNLYKLKGDRTAVIRLLAPPFFRAEACVFLAKGYLDGPEERKLRQIDTETANQFARITHSSKQVFAMLEAQKAQDFTVRKDKELLDEAQDLLKVNQELKSRLGYPEKIRQHLIYEQPNEVPKFAFAEGYGADFMNQIANPPVAKYAFETEKVDPFVYQSVYQRLREIDSDVQLTKLWQEKAGVDLNKNLSEATQQFKEEQGVIQQKVKQFSEDQQKALESFHEIQCAFNPASPQLLKQSGVGELIYPSPVKRPQCLGNQQVSIFDSPAQSKVSGLESRTNENENSQIQQQMQQLVKQMQEQNKVIEEQNKQIAELQKKQK